MRRTVSRVGPELARRWSPLSPLKPVVAIVLRADNANGARAKTRLHAEYGDLDSDYVFVNLWGGRIGHAMSYRGVSALVD
jgi:integrase/recombinase XerD